MIVLVTGGFDHRLRFWEATSGVCSKTLKFPGESQVNCVAVSPDKQLLVAGGNPHIQLYDAGSSADAPLVSFEGHSGNVTAVGFQKDARWVFSASEDGSVRIWDPRTPVCQRCYDGGGQAPAVNALALHPNQTDLVAGDQSGCLKIWDLEASACSHRQMPSPDVPIRSVSIACDASLVAVGLHKGRVHVFNSTDSRVGSSSSSSPHSLQALEPRTDFQAHEDYLLRCVGSPDTQTLATTSADKSIKLWSTGSWQCERTLLGHQRWVWDAAFSADSLYLVSASSDQSAKLWDLRTGEVVRNLAGHSLAVTCVALNDGTVQ